MSHGRLEVVNRYANFAQRSSLGISNQLLCDRESRAKNTQHFASLLAQVVDLICSSLREGVWLLLSFFGGFVLRFLVGAPPVCFFGRQFTWTGSTSASPAGIDLNSHSWKNKQQRDGRSTAKFAFFGGLFTSGTWFSACLLNAREYLNK